MEYNMNYPTARALAAISRLNIHTAVRANTPVAPQTEEEIQALHAYCRMWSLMWEHGPFPASSTLQYVYQEDEHVRRSE
jgi:hypothetical protein